MNYGNEVYFARQRGQHGINSNIFCNTLSLKCSGRWLVTYVLLYVVQSVLCTYIDTGDNASCEAATSRATDCQVEHMS